MGGGGGCGGGGGIFGRILDPLNIFGLNDSKTPKVETPGSPVINESQSTTPTEADPSVALAAADERRRRLAARGGSSTILTGGLGSPGTASTQKKTLLG